MTPPTKEERLKAARKELAEAVRELDKAADAWAKVAQKVFDIEAEP